MLRVKLAGGAADHAAQLRAIGSLAHEHGRGEAELTTRQNDPAPQPPARRAARRCSTELDEAG